MGGSKEGWGHFGDDNTAGNLLARASQCFTMHGAICHEKATLAVWGISWDGSRVKLESRQQSVDHTFRQKIAPSDS